MKLSSDRSAVKHPTLCLFGLLVMVLAFSATGRRYHEARAASSSPGSCVPVAEIDYLMWHRQHTAYVEPDSLMASLRLFATIADKFAAEGTARESRAQPVPGAACEKVFS
jgi:hypothetical protein